MSRGTSPNYDNSTLDAEYARLLTQGAVQVTDCRERHDPCTGSVVAAGAEGNEFCILRDAAERPA